MAQILFIKLLEIKRRNLPDIQTLAFVERIDAWLSQWTVANNFKAGVADDVDNANLLLARQVVHFVKMYMSAIGSGFNIEPAEHFTLKYSIMAMDVNALSWDTATPLIANMDELLKLGQEAKFRVQNVPDEGCVSDDAEEDEDDDVEEITWNNFLRLPTNEWSSYDGIKVPPEFKYAIVDNQHIYFTKLEPVLKPITEGSTVHAWWIDSDDKSNVIKGPCLLAKRLCLVKHPDMNTTCIKRD